MLNAFADSAVYSKIERVASSLDLSLCAYVRVCVGLSLSLSLSVHVYWKVTKEQSLYKDVHVVVHDDSDSGITLAGDTAMATAGMPSRCNDSIPKAC